MNKNIEYGLEGAFKVDLYSGNQLQRSTDWFSNFITATGLWMPSVYAFADCFRFLSLGTNSSSTSNKGWSPADPNPTTGLATPLINGFSTNAGTQIPMYIGHQGYEIGGDGQVSPCGTVLTEQGPAFFRAWSIPTGDIGIVVTQPGGLQIGELMVSPSSGSDPTGCYAFSRITRQIPIPQGWRAIISYQLKIKIQNSGLTPLRAASKGPNQGFTTGQADVTNDLDLVSGWANLSGAYRQVYHGLACVDANGATYIPKYGAIMEPSLVNLKNCAFYLSPDNAAFDVNPFGGAQSNDSAAYQADGLMSPYYKYNVPLTYQGQDVTTMTDEEKSVYYLAALPNRTRQTDFPDDDITVPKNIRLGNDAQGLITPSLEHYNISNTNDIGRTFNYQESQYSVSLPISFATPGVRGFDSTKTDFGQKAVFSTRVFKLPLAATTGRRKTQTRRTMFAPVSAMGHNTRFGSLVCAFTPGDAAFPSKVFYPVIDCLFFDSSSRALMQHYRMISGIYWTERGTGVADAFINITPVSSGNIQRFINRRTVQGEVINGIPQDEGWSSNWPDLYMAGNNQNVPGDFTYTDGNGCSGWGGVIGISAEGIVTGDDYGNQGWVYPNDVGLVDHNIVSFDGGTTYSVSSAPTSSTPLYWPFSETRTNYQLSITGVKFFTTDPCFGGLTSPLTGIPGVKGAAGYNWINNPCGFKLPTGFIMHFEAMHGLGYRLLPNHGIPNNFQRNVYPASTGGSYPGLSLDNGLDLYLDISWDAPCGGVTNCV